mgnify:CR=1 FL=1
MTKAIITVVGKDTVGIIARVCTYLADNYPVLDRDLLLTAAMFHDMGKLTVPHDIITKPGKLSDEEFEQIKKQLNRMVEVIKVMDLTAVSDEEIYERHFYNSLSIAFNDNFNNKSLCDVGAGAGFPSIPLKSSTIRSSSFCVYMVFPPILS